MFKHLYLLFITAIVVSCGEKKEILNIEPIEDYMPLQVGKSITYRIDSTVFTLNGTRIETHKYQVKHTILQETTNGQKAFLVQRLLNNETATGAWVNNGTYLIIPHDNKIEVINDNLRVMALQGPLRQGFTWPGNSQLPFSPYQDLFEMTTGYNLNEWEFTYTGFGDETIEGNNYSNVWTVEQHNETISIPPTPDTKFGSKEVSIEKYAKGIGLVYKNFQLYEYQGGNVGSGNSAYYTGFGITMWMISHN